LWWRVSKRDGDGDGEVTERHWPQEPALSCCS
jgi:hypothetical protein